MGVRFDGLITNHWCPKCQSKTQRDYLQKFELDPDTNHYFFFCKCNSCDKLFLFEYQEKPKKPTKGARYISSMVSDYTVEIELIHVFPESVSNVHSSVDPGIAESFYEGIRCLNSNAPNGAVSVFRRTLQKICLQQGAKKSDLLWKQIEKVIPKELQPTATEIKKWGDLGAHPDPNIEVKNEDAEEMKNFLEKLFLSLYEYPHRLSSSKEKRQKKS